MIDWDKFAARVPVGTRVRRKDGFGEPEYGILLENYPHGAEETNDFRPIPEIMLSHLRFQSFDRAGVDESLALPQLLDYLINGIWLTFHEVMSLA